VGGFEAIHDLANINPAAESPIVTGILAQPRVERQHSKAHRTAEVRTEVQIDVILVTFLLSAQDLLQSPGADEDTIQPEMHSRDVQSLRRATSSVPARSKSRSPPMARYRRRFAIDAAVVWLVSGLGGRAEAGIILQTPAGFNPGDQFRFVFVTDGTRDATSSPTPPGSPRVPTTALGGGLLTGSRRFSPSRKPSLSLQA
jgi:hypothetical protein